MAKERSEYYSIARGFILSYLRTHNEFSVELVKASFYNINPDCPPHIFPIVVNTLKEDKRIYPLNKIGFYTLDKHKSGAPVPNDLLSKIKDRRKVTKTPNISKKTNIGKTQFVKTLIRNKIEDEGIVSFDFILKQIKISLDEYIKTIDKSELSSIIFQLKKQNFIDRGKERGTYVEGSNFEIKKKEDVNTKNYLEKLQIISNNLNNELLTIKPFLQKRVELSNNSFKPLLDFINTIKTINFDLSALSKEKIDLKFEKSEEEIEDVVDKNLVIALLTISSGETIDNKFINYFINEMKNE